MCNEAYRRRELEKMLRGFSQARLPIRFPEGMPNFAPLPSIRITDRVEIVRPAADAPGEAEMVTRRWSWPGPTGKPVYNFRSDGRDIAHASRCLIPVDGFFEFSDAPPTEEADLFGAPAPAPRKGKPLKAKWAFTLAGHDWFAIAGIWRTHPEAGEAWSMLTCPPGPDIAPYHDRQVVVLSPQDCTRWLDPAIPSEALCRPLPAGSLTVERVR